MEITQEKHTYINGLSDKMRDSLLTDFEIFQLVLKIFNQDYKIEMELAEGFQFYTLTNKDITIKSIGYAVDKIIIKGRELSKDIIPAISEKASGKLQWIIAKWHYDREKQYQEQIIEDNKFLREYIKESEE